MTARAIDWRWVEILGRLRIEMQGDQWGDAIGRHRGKITIPGDIEASDSGWKIVMEKESWYLTGLSSIVHAVLNHIY